MRKFYLKNVRKHLAALERMNKELLKQNNYSESVKDMFEEELSFIKEDLSKLQGKL